MSSCCFYIPALRGALQSPPSLLSANETEFRADLETLFLWSSCTLTASLIKFSSIAVLERCPLGEAQVPASPAENRLWNHIKVSPGELCLLGADFCLILIIFVCASDVLHLALDDQQEEQAAFMLRFCVSSFLQLFCFWELPPPQSFQLFSQTETLY